MCVCVYERERKTESVDTSVHERKLVFVREAESLYIYVVLLL